MKVIIFSVVFVAFLGFTAGQTFQTDNLIQSLISLKCNKLVEALKATGLDKTLNSTPAATVFAPTDEAFEKFAALGAKVDLVELLTSHVSSGIVNSTQAVQARSLPTLATGIYLLVRNYTVNGSASVIAVNGARISNPDLMATNGVIHVVESVIYPLPKQTAQLTLAEAAPITDGLYKPANRILYNLLYIPGITVFAPSDAAWSRVPFDQLSNLTDAQFVALGMAHIVGPESGLSGPLFSPAFPLLNGRSVRTMNNQILNITVDADGIKVNGAKVVQADFATTDKNVIHVIDRVMLEGLP